MTIAVYPGSFDPVTKGHLDIVTRASQLFGTVIMAVANNPNKTSMFPLAERIEMTKQAVSHLENVSVETFQGLTIDFAESRQADMVIRGLRAVSDFEFEFALSQMNKQVKPNIETVFLMAGSEYQFLSSSLVKEVFSFGGDISQFVPPVVEKYLLKLKAS